MTIGAKHFDLTLGLDLHLIKLPLPPFMPPVIVPIPHPLPALQFDPTAYLPFIGSGLHLGSLPAVLAGSPGIPIVPHFPIGGTFILPPGNVCEVFMGSSTVAVDGEPLSYTGLPVLNCSDIGIPPIPRLKIKASRPTLYLPTSFVLTIPMGKTVEVGGFPTVSLMALGMAAGMGMFGKIAKGLKALRKKLKKKRRPEPASPDAMKTAGSEHLCLDGHPVHVVSGANVDAFDDALVDGPLPIVWRRHYSSLDCNRSGPIGRGFRHEYERALIRRSDGGFTYVGGDGSSVPLPPLDHDRIEVAAHGHTLRALGGQRFEVRVGDERMEFTLPREADRGLIQRLAVEDQALDFHHDDAGHLVAIWQATGERLCLLRDEAGHIVRAVLRGPYPGDEDEILGSYAYDTEGRLVEWRDGAGNAGHYAYDANHRLTRCTDRRGYAYLFRYDAEGRCVDSTGEDGLFHVALEYVPEEGKTIVTHADGGRWEYRYDARATLTRIVDPYGGARVFRQDEAGRIVEDVDPNGNVTRLLYDDDGRHYARVDPLGYTRLPLDQEPNPPDPLAYELPETPIAWEHGALLDREQIGALDEQSPVLALASPELRRAVIASEPGPRPIWGAWPVRDSNENLVGIRDRDGHVRSWEYASWNLVSREIDGAGHATTYGYTPSAKITKVVGPTGAVIDYLYDHSDRIREVKLRGRVFERYAYDAAGNLIEKRDDRGQVLLSLEAGVGNALAVRRLGSGETQRFERDTRGRIVAATTERLRATFEHDAWGRQIKDYRDGTGVRHRFEKGALCETVYFDRFKVGYRRERGRLVITDPAGNEHRTDVDADGLVVRRLSSGAQEILRYDDEGRCLLKTWRSPGEEEAWVRRFRYSGEGDLLAVEDSRAGTTRYKYDASHRLRRRLRPDGGSDAFEYDGAGNLLEQPGLSGAVIAEGNLITAADGQRFAYNNRDQIASWEGPFGVRGFDYDALDRLVGASINGEPWAAAYDPLCRRVEKIWRGETTRYYWDDFRPAAEVRGDGSLRVYVYDDHAALSPFLFVEYASIDAAEESGSVYFLATDHLGAPVRVEDGAGAVVWSGSMDPFGRMQAERGEVSMPLRFPGHWHDAETGLHFNRFRYYSPDLGRYVEPDPWGLAGGVNLYAYVNAGNPLLHVDIDGLMPGDDERKSPENKRSVAENVHRKSPASKALLKPSSQAASTFSDHLHGAGEHRVLVYGTEDARTGYRETFKGLPEGFMGKQAKQPSGWATTGYFTADRYSNYAWRDFPFEKEANLSIFNPDYKAHLTAKHGRDREAITKDLRKDLEKWTDSLDQPSEVKEFQRQLLDHPRYSPLVTFFESDEHVLRKEGMVGGDAAKARFQLQTRRASKFGLEYMKTNEGSVAFIREVKTVGEAPKDSSLVVHKAKTKSRPGDKEAAMSRVPITVSEELKAYREKADFDGLAHYVEGKRVDAPWKSDRDNWGKHGTLRAEKYGDLASGLGVKTTGKSLDEVKVLVEAALKDKHPRLSMSEAIAIERLPKSKL